MTREQAKKILEAYIACESKKAHFECSEYNCDDSCPLLYEMGTVGEFNEALDMAIQALEQEPRNDVIKFKEDVLDAIAKVGLQKSTTTKEVQVIYECLKVVEALSPVKPQEKTWHWNLFHTSEHGMREDSYFKCNRCNYESYKEYNFCPNCGAKMEVEQNG